MKIRNVVASLLGGGDSHKPRGVVGTLLVAASVFLLVAGIGTLRSGFDDAPQAQGARDASPLSKVVPGSDDDVLARLADYTHSIGGQEQAPSLPSAERLPDVDTMVDRLAARLETAPDDVRGWRMLGWSYFQMARYEQSAAAYSRALELDPDSAEIKRSYEDAKAKAVNGQETKAPSPLSNGPVDHGSVGADPEAAAKTEATLVREHDVAIQSMVDRLADRLESSPRDVEGWSSLMRSRVVLGEREVAAMAFRRALDVFKDDSEASSKITAAAAELGLKTE